MIYKTREDFLKQMLDMAAGQTPEFLESVKPQMEHRAELLAEMEQTKVEGFDFIVQISRNMYLFFRGTEHIDLEEELRVNNFKPTDDVLEFVLLLVKKYNLHLLADSVIFNYADTMERLLQEQQMRAIVEQAETQPATGLVPHSLKTLQPLVKKPKTND